MSLDPLTAGIDLINTAIGKFFPDADEKQKNALALELAQMQAEAAAQQGQLEIDKAEAASPNLFIAGWRPAAGWVSVVALALVYWPKAIFLTGIWVYQCYTLLHIASDVTHVVLPLFPDLGVTDLLGLLGSMLGMGTLRLLDKKQGTATTSFKQT